MRAISVEDLTAFCSTALQKVGMAETDAQQTAEVLVTTDTWGTFSHGTHHLPNYVKKIEAGGIDPRARPEVAVEGSAWAVIDGLNAIGMVPSVMAMNLAIEKAQVSGIAFVSVRHSNHFGAAGFYANMAALRQMIGIAMSNADVNMAAPGSRVAVIGNNPFAYAAPVGADDHILLDIALSATNATKILAVKAEGKALPEKWLVGPDGNPTTEIGDWPFSGSLMPMAGHKGYGLALMVEVLSAVISGGAVAGDVKSWLHRPSEAPELSHSFLAFDVGKMIGVSEFQRSMGKMAREIRHAPTASGVERVYLPGEMESERREAALKHGIVLPETIIEELEVLGRHLGVKLTAR